LQFERRKQGGLDEAALAELFGELGIFTEDMAGLLAGHKMEVLAKRDLAQREGINSTPTMFVNGVRVAGMSDDKLGTLILESAARRKGETAAK
jgi:hypothetical protein